MRNNRMVGGEESVNVPETGSRRWETSQTLPMLSGVPLPMDMDSSKLVGADSPISMSLGFWPSPPTGKAAQAGVKTMQMMMWAVPTPRREDED